MRLPANMGRLAVLLALSCFSLRFCSAVDTIRFSSTLKDPETLVSNRSIFRIGFFSPVNSMSRYVGIWYNNIPVQMVVWVANKNRAINDSSGVISIAEDGNLVIMDGQRRILWSTNVSVPVPANATRAQLLDSGNLVLQHDRNNGEILWESFKHPHDTLLPRMTLGTNARAGTNLSLTSWKSPSDPSTGSYTFCVAPLPFPELFIWKDNVPLWRSGPWNGQTFIGSPDATSPAMQPLLYLYSFVLSSDNQGTVSISYLNDSFMYHFNLDSEGRIFQRVWSEEKQDWSVGLMHPLTKCDNYGRCGQFASCNSRKNPLCKCIKGFEPKNNTEWNRGNWTSGCIRRVLLQCERQNNGSGVGKADGFMRLRKMKVPHSAQRFEANEHDCPKSCLENCSCTAYAYDGGIGCMLWSGSLFDMQDHMGRGADLYIRLANSEIKAPNDRQIIIIVSVVVGTCSIAVGLLLARRKSTKRRAEKERNAKLLFERMRAFTSCDGTGANFINQAKMKELPLLDFQVLAAATDNFALTNKLGQGGFGPVYKGKLREGQEIAVKRLSRASGQGLEELVNEVVVVSKLQHRNLVRLLGCCIEGEERMLVYEFMPKKSLDSYIFDPMKRKLLDWKTRLNIIDGICRGLLYLHRDSRLRIIHRDLKASNILLDEHLNPKISDFGLARIFQGNEDEANTRRVVGTYGYMSPEYAMGGLFSEKSDVFSFGVILLEIVSGRRNLGFFKDEQAQNLLAYAWKLWNERKVDALADPAIYEECFDKEIHRYVHIGLLCVQESANDRPNVSNVIWMLSSEHADLPGPKQPAFITKRHASNAESSEQSDQKASINDVSLTEITAR